MCTHNTSCKIKNVKILKQYYNSDHFPVYCNIFYKKQVSYNNQNVEKPTLAWDNASDSALFSYSRLTEKKCNKLLREFMSGSLSGVQLYNETVKSLNEAATTCIPKYKTKNTHNVPQWRERMASFKQDVDYWVQVQFVNGGPNRCPQFIRQQLRMSRSRYRRQFRHLRREIAINLANSTTTNNCFKRMFRHPKSPTPALIEGHSRNDQPQTWREHFVDVFQGESTPYSCGIMEDINPTSVEVANFNYINIDEINSTITEINTNKSYTRHKHWKYLHTYEHSAKLCLLNIMNF